MKLIAISIIGTILVVGTIILFNNLRQNATEEVSPTLINSEQPFDGNIP